MLEDTTEISDQRKSQKEGSFMKHSNKLIYLLMILFAILFTWATTTIAKANAPTWHINRVSLNGVGERYQVPIIAWGTIKMTGYPIGVQSCLISFGGDVWNPELDEQGAPAIKGYGQAGVTEGLTIYHCVQEEVYEHGCKDEAKLAEPDQGRSWGMQVDQFKWINSINLVENVEKNWELHLREFNGLTLECQGLGLPNRELLEGWPGDFGGVKNLENGTAIGSAPSRWKMSGTFKMYFPQNVENLITVNIKVKLLGQEGSELATISRKHHHKVKYGKLTLK